MTVTALEVERKYDVSAYLLVPELADLPGVASVPPPVEHLLEAVYFDTADLRLREAGVTLRRRTGGQDAGWHLKTPKGPDRQEVRLESARPPAEVPAELLSRVRSVIRRSGVRPVATVTTRRTVHRLLDDQGRLLVEVADDQVTGAPVRGETVTWREWEAELGAGDAALLDAVHARLLSAGATASGSSSKVGRVLGSGGSRPWWGPTTLTVGSSAAAVAVAHLREQVDELVRRDPQVRQDTEDAVHKMRVATRRLRSALQTFGPFLDRSVTDPLRDELRWLAGVLGDARDAEVMHARLRGLVESEPDVVGPVLARIDAVMTERYRTAHDRSVRTLDGQRYLRLLDRLHALVADPPVTQAAYGRATELLPAVVRRAWKRLDRELDLAVAQPAGGERDLMLHEARKDAKRARYVTEAVAAIFGEDARRTAKAAAQLQEALGEHQDGVVTREALRELADIAHRAGEPTFTYGRLHALEQVFADGPDATWPAAREAAARDGGRAWFS